MNLNNIPRGINILKKIANIIKGLVIFANNVDKLSHCLTIGFKTKGKKKEIVKSITNKNVKISSNNRESSAPLKNISKIIKDPINKPNFFSILQKYIDS